MAGHQLAEKALKLEKVYCALDTLTTFVRPILPFLNSHLTEFFTSNYWETLLPPSLREDLESKSLSQVKECVRSIVNGGWRGYQDSHHHHTFHSAPSLEHLVVEVGKLQLSEFRLSVSSASFGLHVEATEITRLQLDQIMSDKKTHEVEVMSDFIRKMAFPPQEKAAEEAIDYLVDVGSGKGYLSSYLTLLHKFKVLAVDSSASNSQGCEKRSARLEKVWTQLLRRALERSLTGTATRRGKHWKSKSEKKRRSSGELEEPPHRVNVNECNSISQCDGLGESKSTSSSQPVRIIGESREESHVDVDENHNEEEEAAGVVVDLDFGRQTVLPIAIPSESQSLDGSDTDNKLLKTLTEFVTQDTDLTQSLSKYFPGFSTSSSSSRKFFGLIGLHTCGNLGIDSLRLFISNKNAKFICNVPCCYHLLDENHLFYPHRNFQGSKNVGRLTGKEDDEVGGELVQGVMRPTFPVSRKLDVNDSSRFCVGRNARMISSYSLPRMIASEEGLNLHPSLFSRSVLQVLVKKYLREEYRAMEDYDHSVGKIGKKCKTFGDYIHLGLKNLQLSDRIEPSDAEIEALYDSFDGEGRIRLQKYYLVRSIFALLLEGIILLDRLAFLLEHDCVEDANIVELFDPAVSPRCHAIVATKTNT